MAASRRARASAAHQGHCPKLVVSGGLPVRVVGVQVSAVCPRCRQPGWLLVAGEMWPYVVHSYDPTTGEAEALCLLRWADPIVQAAVMVAVKDQLELARDRADRSRFLEREGEEGAI